MFKNQKELATKTFYAAVGAPVVMTRNVRDFDATGALLLNPWEDT